MAEKGMPAAARPGAGVNWLLTAAVGLTVATWGSAFAGIRAGLVAYSPAHVALLRYGVASAVLVAYALATRMRLPPWREVWGIAPLGALGIGFYNVALGWGEVTIPGATASFLTASVPVWMALLGWVFWSERLRPAGWLGIAVSLGGVALIALGQGGLHLDPRALAVLAAALVSAIYSIGQKGYLRRWGALECTAYAIWAATLCLVPFAGGLAAEMRAAPLSATVAVVYLGVAPGALAYVAWAYTLARVPAATAGSYLYLVPAFAMASGWLWLGEVPAALSLVGGLLVLGGVIVVNRWGR